MRKGTHSCLECRRRKVRCVIEPNAQKCNGCSARNSQCTEQEIRRSHVSDKRKSTRQRVRELEGVLDQVLRSQSINAEAVTTCTPGVDLTHPIDNSPSERAASAAIGVVDHQPPTLDFRTPNGSNAHHIQIRDFSDAPLLGLFDNESTTHTNPGSASSAVPGQRKSHVHDKHDHEILQTLKLHMPNVKEMSSILRSGQFSLGIWRSTYPEELGTRLDNARGDPNTTLQDHIYRSLYSGDVAVAAKTMLCLTLHIQQLPSDLNAARISLPASSEALQKYYMTSVESLLASDEGLAGTVDGLECMILQSEFYINVGNLRKVWLIVRRAVSLAQLLGLQCETNDVDDKLALRRSAVWLELWQRDRGFSLILGLPYATLESQLPACTSESEDFQLGTERRLFRDLGIAMGHVVDRNQNRSKLTYSVTLKIDEELEECKNTMPASWWETSPDLHMPLDAICSMFVSKMRFYTVRKLLHLPFMLKVSSDHRYEGSRLVALECSREMIKIFRVLRDDERPVMKMCDMVDFQIFSAAMTLVVELLGCPRSVAQRDPYQEKSDWELVHEVMQKLKSTSQSMVCRVAAQGARVLEDFYNARNGYSTTGEDVYEIDIPYFGKVQIRRGQRGFAAKSSPPNPQTNNQRHTLRQTVAEPTSQLNDGFQTPQHSLNVFEGSIDSLVSPDSYFFPLPGALQPWQGGDTGWTSMFDSSVGEDWNWFPNSDVI